MNKEKVTSKGHRDILIILVAAVLMTVAAIIQYVYMRNSIIDSATECAKSDLTISKQNIETEVTAVETAVNVGELNVLSGVCVGLGYLLDSCIVIRNALSISAVSRIK